MSRPSSVITHVLGMLCLGLSVAYVFLAIANQRLQSRIQEQQQILNTGLMGPQGRQIGVSVVQDMTALASKNNRIRDLLERHHYPVPKMATPSNPPASGELKP
jgi:hypothetical protein